MQKRRAELATKFTRDVIVPQAAEYDRTMVKLYDYLHNIKLTVNLPQEYPWPILKEAHSLGLLNTHIPEAVSLPGGFAACASHLRQ